MMPALGDGERPYTSLTSDDRTVSTRTMRAAGTDTATRNVGLLGVEKIEQRAHKHENVGFSCDAHRLSTMANMPQ